MVKDLYNTPVRRGETLSGIGLFPNLEPEKPLFLARFRNPPLRANLLTYELAQKHYKSPVKTVFLEHILRNRAITKSGCNFGPQGLICPHIYGRHGHDFCPIQNGFHGWLADRIIGEIWRM